MWYLRPKKLNKLDNEESTADLPDKCCVLKKS